MNQHPRRPPDSKNEEQNIPQGFWEDFSREFRKSFRASYVGPELTAKRVTIGLLAAWILYCVVSQHGIRNFLFIYGVLLVGAYVWSFIGNLAKGWPYVVSMVGFFGLLWLVVPSYNGWRDVVLAFVVIVSLLLVLSFLVKQFTFHGKWLVRTIVAVWLIFTWSAVSLTDAWFGPHWWPPIAPLATHQSAPSQTNLSDIPKPRVGLALSGGGYRAALFHAGVLAALDHEEFKIPVSALATVSGGSIIGGYYALGGEPELFRDAVSQGRFNLKRELAGILNLVHLLCPGRIPIIDTEVLPFCSSFSSNDVQEALLNKNLFDGATVKDLATKRALKWIVAGTDLVTGQAVGVSVDGIIRLDQAAPRDGIEHGTIPNTGGKITKGALGHLEELQVAKLVAASGAFPGAFQAAPFKISGELGELQMADGGLTDNYGFALLASAHVLGPSWEFDLILISDGTQLLEKGVKSNGVSQLIRAMDVVYASAGIEPVSSENPPPVIRLSSQLLDPDDREEMERIAVFAVRSGMQPTVGAVETRIKQCKQVFLDTSTLQDQFAPDDARCIFDLGVFVVMANFPSITEALRKE